MEFGVFDHLDLGDRPHEQFYRERLDGGRDAAATEDGAVRSAL